MRIPLAVKNFANAIRPTLAVYIRIPGLRINKPVEVLIDTGSPSSFIGDFDAKLMQIPKALAEVVNNTLIAGNNVRLCKLNKEIILKMLDEQNKVVEIKFPLLVGFNFGTTKTVTPTIFGVDFLEQNKLALYFDPSNKIGYLERSEQN